MENKNELKVMLKETFILTAITLISGLLLGFVYELTKEPVRLQQEKAVQEACRAVFPGRDDISFEVLQVTPSVEVQEKNASAGVKTGTIYAAVTADGQTAGHVIESTSINGYGGNIVLYVGVTAEGVLNRVSILTISETPGLGMQAEKVLIPQLENLDVTEIVYTKTGSTAENEIDAISGATITTKAVTSAVNGALRVAQELRGGAENE